MQSVPGFLEQINLVATASFVVEENPFNHHWIKLISVKVKHFRNQSIIDLLKL